MRIILFSSWYKVVEIPPKNKKCKIVIILVLFWIQTLFNMNLVFMKRISILFILRIKLTTLEFYLLYVNESWTSLKSMPPLFVIVMSSGSLSRHLKEIYFYVVFSKRRVYRSTGVCVWLEYHMDVFINRDRRCCSGILYYSPRVKVLITSVIPMKWN